MNKELEQEIKNSQSLPRGKRRKKELMLQKKYKDKSIRIKSEKTFTEKSSLTRKQRRILMSDKDIIIKL